MNTKQVKKIYWGVVMIAIAVFVLLKCFGVNIGFIGTLPLIDVLLAAVVASVMLVSVVRFNFWALPFELAVIFMLFESEIATALGRTDTNLISNWLLLGCAALLSVGLSMIFGSFRLKPRWWHSFKKPHAIKDGQGVRLGSETKYIDCESFTTFSYSVQMGDGNLYFDNIDRYQGGGVLNVDCRMGDLVIHVPAAWSIVTNIESSMGDVVSDGCGTPGGPSLTIQGTCNMGDVEVRYC